MFCIVLLHLNTRRETGNNVSSLSEAPSVASCMQQLEETSLHERTQPERSHQKACQPTSTAGLQLIKMSLSSALQQLLEKYQTRKQCVHARISTERPGS
jgi:hypothetical protein